MAINIQSLFQDIIETPAQRQQRMLQEGILKGRELTAGLTGLARTQAPLVSALMMNMPQQQEALRRGVGGMLGLDVRSESEKVQDALKNVDPNNPQSLLQAAQMIQGLGLGSQAAQMRQMAADVTRQKEADLLARQQTSAQIARDVEATAASVQSREQEKQLFDIKLQAASNDLERQQVINARDDYLYTISTAEALSRVSKIEDEETARRNIPAFVSDLRTAGYKSIANQLEKRIITPREAAELINKQGQLSEDSWARLSNSTIFNRNTGETKTFEETGVETTIEINKNGVPYIVGIGKDGNIVYELNTATLQRTVPGQTIDGTPSQSTTNSFNAANNGQNQEWNNNKILALQKNAQILNSIDAARLHAESYRTATGVIGRTAEQISGIPGLGSFATQRKVELSKLLEDVKGNIAFDRLQKMRDESKTGGALGNVSNIELELLQGTLGSLSADVSLEYFLQQLDKVERHYNNFMAIELGLAGDIDLSGTEYDEKVAVLQNTDGSRDIFILNDDGDWERMSGPIASQITIKKL